MDLPVSEIITGRKCFFVFPDTSLILPSYLEEYFSLGYECYFIEYGKKAPVQKIIKTIITLFKDVIIFFNIDYPLPDLEWDDVIEKLIEEKGDTSSFGVIYTKRQSVAEKVKMEKKYLYDMGLQCGCIQLEYQKKTNFELIAKALFANQAQGRRKTIRALCTSTCTYTFLYGDKQTSYSGSLQDISLSHFSIIIPPDEMPIKLYEKIKDFRFNIQGLIFSSDAVLMMERQVLNGHLCVFAFLNSSGGNGLDPRIKLLLIPTLYKLLSTNINLIIDHELLDMRKQNQLEG